MKVAARIPTRHGEFQLMLFTSSYDRKEHMALIMGEMWNIRRMSWCEYILSASPAMWSGFVAV